mgnify:CR=1 FL=1
MLASLVTGLLISALSGLAYLAVKHHDVYHNVANKLFYVFLVACSIIYSWYSGFNMGIDSSISSIKNTEIQELLLKLKFNELLPAVWFLVFIALSIYLFVLDYLGLIIKQKTNQKTKE